MGEQNQTERAHAAAAGRAADDAQLNTEEEVIVTDEDRAVWEADAHAGENDELATALGATEKDPQSSFFGLKYINDAPVLMLPLLLMDSQVTTGHVRSFPIPNPHPQSPRGVRLSHTHSPLPPSPPGR